MRSFFLKIFKSLFITNQNLGIALFACVFGAVKPPESRPCIDAKICGKRARQVICASGFTRKRGPFAARTFQNECFMEAFYCKNNQCES